MTLRWGLAALGLLVALAPSAAAAFRADRGDRLVGLELTGTVAILFFLAYAEAQRRPALLDLALVASVLAFGGALVYTRFLERWL